MATSNELKIGYVPRSRNAALSQLMEGREQVQGNIAQILDRHWEPVEFCVYLQV